MVFLLKGSYKLSFQHENWQFFCLIHGRYINEICLFLYVWMVQLVQIKKTIPIESGACHKLL